MHCRPIVSATRAASAVLSPFPTSVLLGMVTTRSMAWCRVAAGAGCGVAHALIPAMPIPTLPVSPAKAFVVFRVLLKRHTYCVCIGWWVRCLGGGINGVGCAMPQRQHDARTSAANAHVPLAQRPPTDRVPPTEHACGHILWEGMCTGRP